MKQSNLMSFVESGINILVGFGISVAAQAIFLPMLGVEIPIGANLGFAAIMTIISIARSFLLRRLFEELHIRRPLSPFMQAVVAERYRQIDAEGWTTAHDDDHSDDDLAAASAAYLLDSPGLWPWHPDDFKPNDGQRRNYVKGTALAMALGERFDRNRKRKLTSVGPYDQTWGSERPLSNPDIKVGVSQ